MAQFPLYIDPGSGSYLVQIIIAGLLGVAFYFKSAWLKIKSLFTRNKTEDQPTNENERA